MGEGFNESKWGHEGRERKGWIEKKKAEKIDVEVNDEAVWQKVDK